MAMSRLSVAALLIASSVACDATALFQRPARPLELGTPGDGEDDDPALLRGSDGAYYLAYLSTRDGDKRVWLTRSLDGDTWETPLRVSRPDGIDAEDAYPSLIETDPGTFLIVYTRRFRTAPYPSQLISRELVRGRDGASWNDTAPELAATPADLDGHNGRVVLAPGGEIRVYFTSAFLSTRISRNKGAYNADVYVTQRTPGGRWSDPELVRGLSSATASEVFPDVAATGDGALTAVFVRQASDDEHLGADRTGEIFVAASNDGGATWSTPLQVTHPSAGDDRNGRVHALPRLVRSTEVPTWFIAWTSDLFRADGGLLLLDVGRAAEYPDMVLNVSSAANANVRGWGSATAPAGDTSTFAVWASDNAIDSAHRVRLWAGTTPH